MPGKKIIFWIVLPPLVLFILAFLILQVFKIVLVGPYAYIGYVRFEPIQIEVYAAQTGYPAPDVALEITYRACKFIIFDCLEYEIGKQIFKTDQHGLCSVPGYSIKGKRDSYPRDIWIRMTHEGLTPESVIYNSDSERIISISENKETRFEWAPSDRKLKVWMDPLY